MLRSSLLLHVGCAALGSPSITGKYAGENVYFLPEKSHWPWVPMLGAPRTASAWAGAESGLEVSSEEAGSPGIMEKGAP